MTQRILDARTINHYQMPEQGDQIQFADDSLWTLKQREQMKWGLYGDNNYLHTAIGLHSSLIDLCAAINVQGDFIHRLVTAQGR